MTTSARSYLYIPASRPDRYVKALEAGADAVIFDLEDAVASDQKPKARASLLRELAGAKQQAAVPALPEILVRINCRGSRWYTDDVEACAHLSLDGLVIPKPDDPDLIAGISRQQPGWHIYPLMETAAGFSRIADLAQAPGVTRLMFGSVDLMLDLGVTNEDVPLHYYRTLIVLHSRLAGLPAPVDGVCTTLDSESALEAEIKRAKDFGFQSKLCVHPRQISKIHSGFRPTATEVAWARRVCDAAGSGAAISIDGKLIDAPILEQARRILQTT